MRSVSFDRIAPYYDGLARLVFGRSIQRAQCHFLDRILPGAHVLVVGGGTGWLLPHLLDRPEVAHVTYLETSAEMLAMAQQKVRAWDEDALLKITFVHGNERTLGPEDHFSVVITNFVLDMYEGAALDILMQTLAEHLVPGGIWLFSDFRLSKNKWHRGWQRGMVYAMYAFFRLTTGLAQQALPPYHQHFVVHGLRMSDERSFFKDFIVSRVYVSIYVVNHIGPQ